MSEVAPKAVRGAIVSGYQFCITIGLLLASVVDNSLKDRMDSGSYRIAMSMQWVFALVLGVGLFCLPESPRWFVKKGRNDEAAHALATLRGQPVDSDYVKDELKELVANHDYEMRHMSAGWIDCFRGGWKPSSNFRRVCLGMALQMMQQWTGVNFSKFLPYTMPHWSLTIQSLLLWIHLLPICRDEERFPRLDDYHRRQCGLYPHFVLDH